MNGINTLSSLNKILPRQIVHHARLSSACKLQHTIARGGCKFELHTVEYSLQVIHCSLLLYECMHFSEADLPSPFTNHNLSVSLMSMHFPLSFLGTNTSVLFLISGISYKLVQSAYLNQSSIILCLSLTSCKHKVRKCTDKIFQEQSFNITGSIHTA
jgi:hypothetical protein